MEHNLKFLNQTEELGHNDYAFFFFKKKEKSNVYHEVFK